VSRLLRFAPVAVIASLLLTACGMPESAAEDGQAPVTVRAVSLVADEQVAEPLRFAGIVRARQRATLTFQVSGVLRERSVELGETVAAGQVLAAVYNPGLEPARDSARARLGELSTQLEQAQREWERSVRLRERGVVSEQELEQITSRRDGLRASVATAEAAVAEASQMLNESTLKAPFAGRVEALLVEKDEFVSAGQPVLRLSSPEGREVEIRVPAYLLNQVVTGQELPVWAVQNRLLQPVTGIVSEIAQAGAVRGELHPIRVALPEESLRVGEPVEVGVTSPLQGRLSVPIVAVMKTANGTSIFRIEDGVARRVPVTVERIIGEQVVVASGHLSASDQVIYAGMTRLTDGDPVEILQ